MKLSVPLFATCVFLPSAAAFAPSLRISPGTTNRHSTVETETEVSVSASLKPTGTSFLPEETVERCKVGSPIEKIKLAKDPINAWVDVYEYARKIREGEMTWEEVESADLDSVSRAPNAPAPPHPLRHLISKIGLQRPKLIRVVYWVMFLLPYLTLAIPHPPPLFVPK